MAESRLRDGGSSRNPAPGSRRREVTSLCAGGSRAAAVIHTLPGPGEGPRFSARLPGEPVLGCGMDPAGSGLTGVTAAPS